MMPNLSLAWILVDKVSRGRVGGEKAVRRRAHLQLTPEHANLLRQVKTLTKGERLNGNPTQLWAGLGGGLGHLDRPACRLGSLALRRRQEELRISL